MILKKRSLYNFLIVVVLSLMLGAASLSLLGSESRPANPVIVRLRYVIIIMGLGVLFLFALFRKWHFSKGKNLHIELWLLFGFAVLLSALVNLDINVLVDGIWYVLVVPLFFFVILPRLMGEHTNKFVVYALLLGHLPYIVISVLKCPQFTLRYRGILANSNQFGGVALVLALCMLSLLNIILTHKSPIVKTLLIIFGLLASLTLIILSLSRTALFTAGILFLVVMWGKIKYSRRVFRVVLVTVLCLSIGVLLARDTLVSFTSFLVQGVASKFTQKLEADDLLSGRDYIWSKTLKEARLWGHGSSYFSEEVNKGAHNSVIKVIGESGFVAVVFLVGFAFWSGIQALIYYRKFSRQDPFAIAPLLICVCFWVFSMAEGLLGAPGRGITLAYFTSVGRIITHAKKPS